MEGLNKKQWTTDSDNYLLISTRDAKLVNGDRSSYEMEVGGNTIHAEGVSRLVPVQVCVPNIFPNVKAPYNTVSVQDNGVGFAIIKTLTPGQYSATNFFAALNILFTPDNLVFSSTPDDSGRVRITSTDAAIKNMFFTADNLGRLVGQTTQLDVPAGGVVDTAWPRNLAGERVVHLKSKVLSPHFACNTKTVGISDVFVSVPMDRAAYGDIQVYEAGGSDLVDLEYLGDRSLNSIDVTVMDEQFQPLPLPPNVEIVIKCKVYHSGV